MKKHELLQKAMKDYPAGTIARSVWSGDKFKSTGLFKMNGDDVAAIDAGGNELLVFEKEKNKWAEIVSDKVFVMTSEDGVPLYEGDEFIHVSNRFEDKWALNDHMKFYASKTHVVTEQPETDKAFSTKEAALKWIDEQNKPKEIIIDSVHGKFTVTKHTVSFKSLITSGNEIELSGTFFDKIVEARKSLQS